MSRSHHPRPSRSADVALFIRVPREVRDALRKRLAEQRRRRPWEHVSLSHLVRQLVLQSLDMKEDP